MQKDLKLCSDFIEPPISPPFVKLKRKKIPVVKTSLINGKAVLHIAEHVTGTKLLKQLKIKKP